MNVIYIVDAISGFFVRSGPSFPEKELHFLTFLQLIKTKVCAHHSTNRQDSPCAG